MTRLLCAVIAVSGLVACGDKKQPPAPPPPPPPIEPAKPIPPDDRACKLFTKDDAARLLTVPVLDGTAQTLDHGSQCNYVAPSTQIGVSVSLYDDGQDALARSLKLGLFGAEPVQIAGVGTKAFRSEKGTPIGVFTKGKFVALTVAPGTQPTPDAAQKLLELLVNRL